MWWAKPHTLVVGVGHRGGAALHQPTAGVLDLVHVVKVPARDELLTAVIALAASQPAIMFPQVHQASGGRLNQL
jgi:hypothetical protein